MIGRDNALPWHLPADLKRFKSLTTGHTLIMGRKTFDAIGKALPGRRTIVLSRNPEWRATGVEIVPDLDAALRLVAGEAEVFVAGGAEIYRQALPLADRIYLTQVHGAVEGDARFPEIDPHEWRLTSNEHHPIDDRHAFEFSFQCYQRVQSRNHGRFFSR